MERLRRESANSGPKTVEITRVEPKCHECHFAINLEEEKNVIALPGGIIFRHNIIGKTIDLSPISPSHLVDPTKWLYFHTGCLEDMIVDKVEEAKQIARDNANLDLMEQAEALASKEILHE